MSNLPTANDARGFRSLIAKSKSFAGACRNLLKAVGPFAVILSDTASERWAQHQRRLTDVEVEKQRQLAGIHAVSDLIARQTATYTAARDECVKRWLDAGPLERIGLERDIEHIESRLRYNETVEKATLYLPPPKAADASTRTIEQQDQIPEISGHWIDTFIGLAKNRNEDWRQELLARALAAEASNPGTVLPRTILMIGTLEERLFRLLSVFVDISIAIAGNMVLPTVGNGWYSFYNTRIDHHSLQEPVSINSLIYQLGCEGFVAGGLIEREPQEKHIVNYTAEKVLIEYTKPVSVTGKFLTDSAQRLVTFHDFKEHPVGNSIFDKFLSEIGTYAVVTRHQTTQTESQ